MTTGHGDMLPCGDVANASGDNVRVNLHWHMEIMRLWLGCRVTIT